MTLPDICCRGLWNEIIDCPWQTLKDSLEKEKERQRRRLLHILSLKKSQRGANSTDRWGKLLHLRSSSSSFSSSSPSRFAALLFLLYFLFTCFFFIIFFTFSNLKIQIFLLICIYLFCAVWGFIIIVSIDFIFIPNRIYIHCYNFFSSQRDCWKDHTRESRRRNEGIGFKFQ